MNDYTTAAVFYAPFPDAALATAAIFVAAAITDYFDGYLARKVNCRNVP